MHKYHCPRCKVDFYREVPNINEKHHCGEFAMLDWGVQAAGEKENGS